MWAYRCGEREELGNTMPPVVGAGQRVTACVSYSGRKREKVLATMPIWMGKG